MKDPKVASNSAMFHFIGVYDRCLRSVFTIGVYGLSCVLARMVVRSWSARLTGLACT